MRYLLLLLFCSLSNAAIIDVTESNTDPSDGNCDLYSAIESANTDTAVGGCTSGNGDDTIRLSASIQIDRALPDINSVIRVQGYQNLRTVEPLSSYTGRVFSVGSSGDLTLLSLNVRNGDSGSQPGGCILSYGQLTVNNSHINYCVTSNSDYGAGIHQENGLLTISSSVFLGNSTGKGIGIYNSPGASIYNSEIINGTGVGIYVGINSSGAEVNRVKVKGNQDRGIHSSSSIIIDQSSSTNNNGGVYCDSGCMVLNSTLANNEIYGLASSIGVGSNIINTTFYNNGTYDLAGRPGTNVINSAFGSSATPKSQSCIGLFAFGTNNVSDTPGCPGSTLVTDIDVSFSGSSQTEYYIPNTNSPLISAGDQYYCDNQFIQNRDQINTIRPRPANTNCEAGSIEVNQGIGGTTPNISLIKTGVFDDNNNDGFAQPGETITYSFTVENTGSQTLTNITISDPLINVLGTIFTLAPSQSDSSTFSAVYTLTQADINNGQVDNTATVSGTGDDDTVTDTDSHSEPLSEPPTAPGISLLKSGNFDDNNNDGFAQAGETITYSFTVENTGTQTLNNVYITDPMFNVPGTVSGMVPGAVDSTTFTASYTLTQNDIDNAQVDNTATVSGTGDDDIVTDTDSHSEPLAVQSSIELTKSGVFVDETGDGYAQIGETIDYSFVVENTGDDTLYNITINDPLMAVQGQLASLAPGATDSTTFSGVYGLNAADLNALQVDNIATVTGTSNSNGQVTDISNNNVPFVVTYDVLNEITLLKSGVFDDNNNDGFAQPGETITYSFVAENIGSQDLYNAIISDPIISNVTPSPHPDTLHAQAIDVIFDDGFDDDDDAIVAFTGTYAVTQADIDAGFVSNIAQVDATTGDENVTAESNNGVPLIVDLNGVPADISLLKFGVFDDNNNDGFTQAGETVSYSFTVENTGGVTLSNVTINDPLFPVVGSLASMAPTAVDSTTFTGVYTLTQADVDAGFVSNLATVTSYDPSNVVVTDQSNSGQPLVTPLPFNNSISLVKSGSFDDNNSDGFAQAGETVTYSFVVENTGNQTLTNVTITDPLVTVNGSLATMAPGVVDSTTFTAVYTLTQSDVDNGIISNTATVNGTTPQNTSVSDSDNHNEPLPNDSGITLVKNGSFDDQSGDGFAQAGETVTYSFVVENTSTVTLSNVSISDPLITVTGSLATMGPGAVDSSTFSGVYTLTQSDIDTGQVDNIATVTGTTPSNNTVSDVDTHTVTLGVNAEIDLLKFGVFDDNNNDGFAQAGETVSYSFTVENTGGVTLSNVTINDPLFTVNGSVASMAPGDVDTSTFTGTYTLTQADVDAAQVSNLATVVGLDPSGSAVTDQSNSGQPLITPLPFNNSITLVKTGVFDDNSGDGFAQAGETVSYSFSVENTGTQTLSNVTISDPLVTVNGSVASMAPGVVNSTAFTAVYTLTQADVNSGVVDNTATVNATDPQSEAVSDNDDHSEPLPVESGIVLIKVGSFNDGDGDGYAQVGETITYGFSVENTSSQTLSNITITDPLITVNGSLASMLPGAIDSTTFSGTYTLTQADIDAGEVINTATVTGTTPQDDSVSDDDSHTEPLPIFRAVVQVPVNNPFALLLLCALMVVIMRRKLVA